MRTTMWWLVLVLGVGLALSGCRQETQTRPVTPPSTTGQKVGTPSLPPPGEGVGKEAPDFTVVDVDGDRHSHSDYKGRVLVVDFWAIYCKPCVKKLAEYKEKYNDYHNAGVDFLALSMDESDEAIRGWRQKQPEGAFPFPLARLDDETRKAFFGEAGIIPIPQVRIIDRKGILRYALEPDSTTEQVFAAVQALLDEKR